MNKCFFFLLMLPVLVFGCKDNATELDSNVPKEEGKTAPLIDSSAIPLPDTMYASVAELEYSVTIFDSITSGELEDFVNSYGHTDGIFTFRGGPLRDASFVGKVTGIPDTILTEWVFKTDYDKRHTKYGTWGGGTGWTGQPLYVCWPDSCMDKFHRNSKHLTKNFSKEEILVGSLDGRIYFIDYQSGKMSRDSFNTQNPIKGTMSLDPSLNGNLYVGQGIPATQPFGFFVFNLFTHQNAQFFGYDKNSWKHWDANDASAIRCGRFLFRNSENGTVYKYLIKENGALTLHSTMRYCIKGFSTPGMEASLAIYKNYGYLTDNHGHIICFNLNTLKPVWHYFNHDDSDATPVIDLEEGHPYVYSGCEVDRRGDSATSHIVKLNALNGDLVWEQPLPAKRAHYHGQTFDGGVYGTPLLGRGDCKDLIFINFVNNLKPMAGEFMALKKSTGEVVYRIPLKHYPWSSPICLLNEKEKMFVFTGDTWGYAYLIDAKAGKITFSKHIGNNFESSPIIIDNHVVVGSRGQEIYKLKIE